MGACVDRRWRRREDGRPFIRGKRPPEEEEDEDALHTDEETSPTQAIQHGGRAEGVRGRAERKSYEQEVPSGLRLRR